MLEIKEQVRSGEWFASPHWSVMLAAKNGESPCASEAFEHSAMRSRPCRPKLRFVPDNPIEPGIVFTLMNLLNTLLFSRSAYLRLHEQLRATLTEPPKPSEKDTEKTTRCSGSRPRGGINAWVALQSE